MSLRIFDLRETVIIMMKIILLRSCTHICHCRKIDNETRVRAPFLDYITWEVECVGRFNAMAHKKGERDGRRSRAALTFTFRYRPHAFYATTSGEIIDDHKLSAIGRKSRQGDRLCAPSHSPQCTLFSRSLPFRPSRN